MRSYPLDVPIRWVDVPLNFKGGKPPHPDVTLPKKCKCADFSRLVFLFKSEREVTRKP